ncbi:hypothetical protein [Leeuwenhoekiella sp. MAR_2009_132]|uniref:hypothetical protein n=1 Tax=Leeuwenhoekiella sp. MAR_2009_132 TaxID=1392489 RepID=UPI0004920A11|nr:hypothetical protein [Leeuwenhoekiella sp. MAR_2009_132]
MELGHKKNSTYLTLGIAIVWVILILFRLFLSNALGWFDILMMGLAIYYFCKFYYLKTHPYLKLTESHFVKYCILKTTRIPIASLKGFHSNNSGDFVLVGSKKKIWISSKAVDQKSFSKFKEHLKHLKFNS